MILVNLLLPAAQPFGLYLALGLHTYFPLFPYFLFLHSPLARYPRFRSFSGLGRLDLLRFVVHVHPARLAINLALSNRGRLDYSALPLGSLTIALICFKEGFIGSSLETHQLAMLCLDLPCSNGASDYDSK